MNVIDCEMDRSEINLVMYLLFTLTKKKINSSATSMGYTEI